MTLIDFSPEVFPEYNVTTLQKVSWKYDCSFITSLENYTKVSYYIGKLSFHPIETLLRVHPGSGEVQYSMYRVPASDQNQGNPLRVWNERIV